jgi:hypothetical protein
LQAGQMVDAVGVANDGVARRVRQLRLVAYDVPAGCVGGYYPECNPVLPLAHHAKESKVPAAKSIAIRLEPAVRSAGH